MSVLKATTARSPCRKIPRESIKAPSLQPFGVGDTDVLEKTDDSAPTGPESAPSPSWDNILTPLTAAMGLEQLDETN